MPFGRVAPSVFRALGREITQGTVLVSLRHALRGGVRRLTGVPRLAAGLAVSLGLCVVWTACAISLFPCSHSARCDAAIVLGAWTKHGEPSPVFVSRIAHAIYLYRKGTVRKLIFTGGRAEGEPTTLAEAARFYALEHGVPAVDIIVEPYSRSTYENLAYSKRVAAENGLRSFLVVSDPLHMRRAMRMAADLDIDAQPSATPTTRYITVRDRFWFLKRETCFYLQYVLVRRFTPGRSYEDAEREAGDLLNRQMRVVGTVGPDS